jgi:hypothetical protein
MADNIHNQWLREISLDTGNQHGITKLDDNFCQKKRIFCNSANHRSIVNLNNSLRKNNNTIITNGYIYLITKLSIGTVIALTNNNKLFDNFKLKTKSIKLQKGVGTEQDDAVDLNFIGKT